MQCDPQPPNERVAYRAALQVVPTAFPAMVAAPMEVENGLPMQTDLATPRCRPGGATGQCGSPGPCSSVHLD